MQKFKAGDVVRVVGGIWVKERIGVDLTLVDLPHQTHFVDKNIMSLSVANDYAHELKLVSRAPSIKPREDEMTPIQKPVDIKNDKWLIVWNSHAEREAIRAELLKYFANVPSALGCETGHYASTDQRGNKAGILYGDNPDTRGPHRGRLFKLETKVELVDQPWPTKPNDELVKLQKQIDELQAQAKKLQESMGS